MARRLTGGHEHVGVCLGGGHKVGQRARVQLNVIVQAQHPLVLRPRRPYACLREQKHLAQGGGASLKLMQLQRPRP